MNLVKYNRRRPVPVNNIIDDFFNVSLSDFLGSDFVNNMPSINILEEKDKFVVEVAAPGLLKSDFDVKVDNNHLVISATQNTSSEVTNDEHNEDYTRKEFNYSSFKRSFHLPETVDASKVNATYLNGILNISIDKKEESIDRGPLEIKIK